MDDVVTDSLGQRRFQMALVLLFAAAGTLLASLGIYGVVSYSVARRGREMGIRMALGARPGDIHRLVVAEGLVPAGAGLAVGLAGSLAIGRAVSSLLFDVRPGDPRVLLGAAAIVIAATLLACIPPARRAAGTGLSSLR